MGLATVNILGNKTSLATDNVYPSSATPITNCCIHSFGPPTCALDIQGVSVSYWLLLRTETSSSSVQLWFFSNVELSTWVLSTFICHDCCSARPGYVPLGARDQVLHDLPLSVFKGIRCREVHLQGRNGAKLSGILVHRDDFAEEDIEVVLAYFQGKFGHSEILPSQIHPVEIGNAGNPLQRIPIFQHLCKSIPPCHYPKTAILAIAPRSYWKSTPRWPTQSGIIQDYCDTVHYALREFPAARVILYGHSLGGAAAICTLNKLQQSRTDTPFNPCFDRIRGLVLENTFTSIPAMVRALYPQRWLPYRYLAPLAFDRWDVLAALKSHVGHDTVLGRISRNMLVLVSEHDEVVPQDMGVRIFKLATQGCHPNGTELVKIPKALHEDAWTRKMWTDELRKYILRVT